MHTKRALIRLITRILYAGGFVFLIVGLLLSALSSSVMAAGAPAQGLAQETAQITPPNCYCATSTPVVTDPTATNTGVPGTAVPTRAPMQINLSNICGYTFDTFSLWKVANHGNSDVAYHWLVVGTSEAGSGTVRANSDDYFTTTPGVTVRLFVGDQLMDTESCLAPCKQEIQLSYTCTADGLTWRASNTNTFGVDYTVRVDNQEVGRGTIPANSTVDVATSAAGAHSVELTWTDTRPGTHTVRLSSPPDSCPVRQTFTPTVTSTPLPQEVTVTPTVTATVTSTPLPQEVTVTPTVTATVTFTPQPQEVTITPSVTPTVTSTSTAVVVNTLTLTPTVTQTTQPNVVPTGTFTPTVTATNTATATQTLTPGPTFTSTFTPTTTLTPLAGFVPSATLTSTPTITRTATPIGTLAAPVGTITSTPVLIPVTGVDLTLPIGANGLSVFGGLLTNLGLFALGLALALTGINSQIKD